MTKTHTHECTERERERERETETERETEREESTQNRAVFDDLPFFLSADSVAGTSVENREDTQFES